MVQVLVVRSDLYTLFCRYAGALFAESCLKGLNGAPDIVECSYVASTVVPGLPYFSSKV